MFSQEVRIYTGVIPDSQYGEKPVEFIHDAYLSPPNAAPMNQGQTEMNFLFYLIGKDMEGIKKTMIILSKARRRFIVSVFKLWSYQCRRCSGTYKDIIYRRGEPVGIFPKCPFCDERMSPYVLGKGFLAGSTPVPREFGEAVILAKVA